ncbi:MAG: transglutaminase domain-containing protein, partial [Spirochaetales bacterium]
MKKLFSLCILLFIITPAIFSQQNNILSINTVPYGSIPLGSSAEVFNLGAGMEASAFFIPSALRFVGPQLGANFSILPLESADAIWTIAGFAGPLVRIPLGDRCALLGHGEVGYYYWTSAGWDAGGTNGGGLMISAGAKGTFRIAGPFTLGVGVSYDYYANLYNGLRFELAARFVFSSAVQPKPAARKPPAEIKPEPLIETGKGVEMRDIKLFQLFPVLYKYYDNNPVGIIRVKNFGTLPAENIKINFFVERYMDNPMTCCEPFSLGPGEEKAVELFGLFTEDMMEITEGTKASARITLSCDQSGEAFTDDYNPVLEVHNRNALSWDDDRKIASFITAKDPEILGFAKNVMTWMQEIKNPAIDENLQKGMAIYEAVRSYGIRYQIDPATPFSELSEQKEAVDFLQFPRQTLEYSNGDCDDLSALYTSLMEAAGVESAVITIPGHIFAAFALKSSPEEARRGFSKPDNLAFLH